MKFMCILHKNIIIKVMKIGINDVFGESGSASVLVQKYGLDGEGVYNKIKDFLK